MNSANLITVVYAGDLANLYYHALSLKRYWMNFNPEHSKWTIVVEDGVTEGRNPLPMDATYTKTWCEKNIVPLMAGWDIEVVNCPINKGVDGWHRQQIAKLWAAARSDKVWSIVLDCKNFLVRPTIIKDFFKDDAVLIHVHNDRPVPDGPSQDQVDACKLLDKDVNSLREAFNITPFVWKNQLVKELITELKIKNYDIYEIPTIISEAVLYWCYAQDKLSWIDDKSFLSAGQYGGCFEQFRLTTDDLQKELIRLINSDIKWLVMHRFHTTPMAFSMISEFLKGRWIITDTDIAFYKKTFLENLHATRPTVVEFLEPKWKPKEITVANRSIKFDRIVAYGCSYTGGSELADYLYDPLIPIQELDNRKRKEKSNFYDNYLVNCKVNTDNDIKSIEKNLSWAAHLANEFEVAFVNRARPGNSHANSVYDIERDLKSGFLTNLDFIIIGITSPDRWLFFDDNGNCNRALYVDDTLWPSKELYNEFIKNISNDYFNMYHWFTSIKYLDMLSDRLGGRLMQQYVHHTYKDYRDWTSKKLNRNFIEILDEINSFKSILDHDYSIGKLVNWNSNDIHGFYHPKIKFHKQFANHITKKLTGIVNE
jgi:hypothetical protein